jgi:hypothetical protein
LTAKAGGQYVSTQAMAEEEKTYIYHIYRKDGSSLLLHPLTLPAKVVEILEKTPLEGRYGKEPQVEVLSKLRDELYRQVELGVRHWVADQRFVPRFLISSAAFVAAYLFFSIVVRDPVPVIDEIVLGVAAAVGTFLFIGRRDLASSQAAKKRLDLRQLVDRITFRESRFVKTVEEALHSAEGESVEQVVRRIVEPLGQVSEAIPEAEGSAQGEAAQFVRLLEQRFNFRKLERGEPGFRRLARRRAGSSLPPTGKVDLPLYAVYKSCKRTVGGRR